MLEARELNALRVNPEDKQSLQLLKGASKCVLDNKTDVEKATLSSLLDQLLSTDIVQDAERRQKAESEAQIIASDTVEDITDWSKEVRSGEGNGIRFNARTMRITLSQFTASPKGHEAF